MAWSRGKALVAKSVVCMKSADEDLCLAAVLRRFNTTKCHVVCGSVLSAHREDRREKWCDVCRCAVDRDGNASLNIESVWPHYLAHGTRPGHLCRGM